MRTGTLAAERLRLILCPLIAATLWLAGCSRFKPSAEQQLEGAIVAASHRHPGYSAKWDPVVRDLAHQYVRDLIRNRADRERGAVAKRALAAGCTDPFVRYVVHVHQTNNEYRVRRPEFSEEIRAIVDEMQAAEYPPFLRAYAENRAYLQWYFYRDPKSPITNSFSQQNWQDVFATLNDPVTPEWLARTLVQDICELWSKSSQRQELADRIEGALKVHYGDSASVALLHAQNALDLVRRQVYGHEAGPDANKNPGGMTDLPYAQAELQRAWQTDQKDPRIPTYMIEVCTFGKLPREQLELWFQRAVSMDRTPTGAAELKFSYLSPEWYGSFAEQLEFARSTLKHPEYGPDASMLIERAHREHARAENLGDEYFGRPEVWADLRAAYLVEMENFPYIQYERLDFARYAWLAKDWATLNEQLSLIDLSLISPGRVGGQDILDQMVADAHAHRDKPVKPDAQKSF